MKITDLIGKKVVLTYAQTNNAHPQKNAYLGTTGILNKEGDDCYYITMESGATLVLGDNGWGVSPFPLKQIIKLDKVIRP